MLRWAERFAKGLALIATAVLVIEAVAVFRDAIATEAQRAETTSGSVHEGAGPQDIAQNA